MAIIGTFGSFTTARLGIYASQAALNITGNNIANINTTGYTRQRLDLVSLYSQGADKYANIFNTNIGYGVLTQGRSQLRDPFLDIRYRNENSNLGACSETQNGLYQISQTLDEVNKGTGNDEGYGVIAARLENFKDALEELHINVGSQAFDTLVRGEAESLTTFFKEAADALQSDYDGKMEQFYDYLDDINMLLTDIRDLNEQIRTQAIYGDKALELRDKRNLDLDQLSEYLHINVEYSMERIDQFTEVEKLTVTIADSVGADGKPIKLIDGIYGGQLSVQEREPLMNPEYDALKIRDAMNQAQAEAEEANAKDVEPWATKFADARANATATATAAAEAANPLDSGEWAEKIAAATAKAQEAAEKKYPEDDPDRDDKIAADVAAAEEKVMAERQAVIDAEVAKAVKAAEKEVEAERKEAIENAVANDPNLAEAIEKYGKYLMVKVDDDGNPVTDADGNPVLVGTNDLYELDGNGNPVIGEDGKYVYNENVVTYKNDKLLLQVEPLVDRRDRLMVDSYTVSKKSEVVELDDTVLFGKLQSIRELLTEEGEYASYVDLNKDEATGKDADPPRLSGDPNASIKRGIPYYQQALDTFARQFAEVFNQANQLPATTVYQMNQATPGTIAGTDTFKDADGNDVTYVDDDGNVVPITVDDVTKVVMKTVSVPVYEDDGVTQKKDDEGNLIFEDVEQPVLDENNNPVRTFYSMSDPEYGKAGELLTILGQKAAKDPLYEFYDGGVLFSTSGNNNDPSGITASNISISNAWANNTVHILNDTRPDEYLEDGSVLKHTTRNENIQHMITLFDKQLDYNTQDLVSDSAAKLPMFTGSFREIYTTICGTLATDLNIANGKVDNYSLMTLSLENDRQSVSGVDLNDEATAMMQYSKSYSAACRLLTVLDEMLDRLINGTAV